MRVRSVVVLRRCDDWTNRDANPHAFAFMKHDTARLVCCPDALSDAPDPAIACLDITPVIGFWLARFLPDDDILFRAGALGEFGEQ